MGRGESKESSPRLENDSIVYAYSAALERESNKRKREECFEDGIDALFSGSLGKRIVLNDEETPKYDFSKIECNLQSLSDRLDELKKQTLDNATVLMEIQQTMQ